MINYYSNEIFIYFFKYLNHLTNALFKLTSDCFSGSDFLCQNHRCIPSQLNCDGFDHCGDNSDEPTTCFRDYFFYT